MTKEFSGFVYAIESGDAVKIGFSKDPISRLTELNIGAPGKHRLIGFARGDKCHEREIHEICRNQRIRGEWFRNEGHVSLFLDHLPKFHRRGKLRSVESAAKYRPNLISIRMELGITQRDLANKCGVSRWTINRIELGERNPSVDLIQRISDATDGKVSPADFFASPAVR